MASKRKYYVVWRGYRPGVYNNWQDCQSQVIGFENARFKSFPTKAEAEYAFRKGPGILKNTFQSKKQPRTGEIKNRGGINKNSISVDAACSGNPGKMEYRGVDTATHEEIFHLGPIDNATNNIGEFLAIVHALALLKRANDPKPLYSDSRTAIAWVKKKKANSKLAKNESTKQVWDLIGRAENWLRINLYSNPILKWETEKWGEIPADFGRK
jgi:ribonuclease HI